MKKQILVVSQDKDLIRRIQSVFIDECINIFFAKPYAEMEQGFYNRFDLIMIDMLDFELGLLKAVQVDRRTIPIMILHTGLSVQKKILLYRVGAAALLERTTAAEICSAQALALIRLHTDMEYTSKPYPLIFGTELMIDPSCRIVKVGKKILDLTRKEFDLLLCFAQNPNQVLSLEQLYEDVWKDEANGSIRTVQVQIGTLKRKMKKAGKNYIENCWGTGYKFIPPDPKTDG